MKNWPMHDAKLDIGLPSSGGREEDFFRFTLYDEKSGVQLFEMEIAPHELAIGMASRGRRPVRINFNPNLQKLMGAEKELKTIPIFVPECNHVSDPYSKRGTKEMRLLDQALAPYEHDGWQASVADLQNGHRVVGKDDIPTGAFEQLRELAGFKEGTKGRAYNVSFHRWVRDGQPVIL